MPDTAPKRLTPVQNTKAIDSPLNRRTEHNIHVYSMKSREAINQHVKELEREWSIERSIEASASLLAVIGIALGAFVSPWCLLLPLAVSLFFMAHALFAFCPESNLFQGHGMRTHREIETEIFAMKALRGDALSSSNDEDKASIAERAIDATRKYCSDN